MKIFKIEPKIKFINKRYYAFALSGLIILAGLVTFVSRGFNMGIDFSGGTTVQLSFTNPVPIEAARAALERNGFLGSSIQEFTELVRRFFPKQTDLAQISKSRVQSVERWLNHRPRKCLGFRTPAEVFKSAGVALAG